MTEAAGWKLGEVTKCEMERERKIKTTNGIS